MNEPKKRCYFYDEYIDMGGTVPVCGYYKAQGNPPCEGCKTYISRNDVSEFVRFLVKFREKYMNGEGDAVSVNEALSKLNGIVDAGKKAADALRSITTRAKETTEQIETIHYRDENGQTLFDGDYCYLYRPGVGEYGWVRLSTLGWMFVAERKICGSNMLSRLLADGFKIRKETKEAGS